MEEAATPVTTVAARTETVAEALTAAAPPTINLIFRLSHLLNKSSILDDIEVVFVVVVVFVVFVVVVVVLLGVFFLARSFSRNIESLRRCGDESESTLHSGEEDDGCCCRCRCCCCDDGEEEDVSKPSFVDVDDDDEHDDDEDDPLEALDTTTEDVAFVFSGASESILGLRRRLDK